ncbi:hypothetical protein KAW50_04095 [candidate division WOR-3 bacterium]|nr:hypothetical protein [candidate division WOR-3 bacterium]
MTKKKYANAAEKQRAWRIRHGQKQKVPLALRRGEELGASETTFRQKKEDESWEDYHKYLTASINAARKRQKSAGGKEIKREVKPGGDARGQRVYPGDYYEMRREVDKPPEGKKIKEKFKGRKRKNE